MAVYITNKEFKKLLVSYRDMNIKVQELEGKEKDDFQFKIDRVYNKIGKCFLLISTNLLNKSSFINYTHDRKDGMISDATFYMSKYVDRFDVEQGNPFAYFTRVAYNAFIQNISDYKKRDDIFHSLEYIDSFSNDEGLGNI